MAPIGTTPSPRDHAADDNPNLARKRQRLSEDPALSPASSVYIELGDTDEMGTDLAHSILIEPDLHRYSDAFAINDVVQPQKCLDELREQLERDYHIEPTSIFWFTDALENHIMETKEDSSAWRLHYLEREADFFASVVDFAYCFLNTRDHFEPNVELKLQALQDIFYRMMVGIFQLCHRILPLLPEAVRTVLSRRDSALGSNPRLSVHSLRIVVLTEKALDHLSPATFQFLRKSPSAKLHKYLIAARSRFADSDISSSLVEVIRGISGSMRDIKDSWLILGSALAVFRISIDYGWTDDDFPLLDAETVMETIHSIFVPTVRGKHPRALPPGFHENMVQHGEQLLLFLACKGSSPDDVYERFVKSPKDALFEDAPEDESGAVQLEHISGASDEVAARLLALSWAFQTMHSLISSDIMDVRWTGITLLNQRLIELRTQVENDKFGRDHPHVQYVIRFLRKNKMTDYMFGPESHAGLIEASKDVSAFLAATQSHTSLETDLIWQTCTTSVEADFVKAAIGVLIHIARWLPFDQVLYVVSKYAETPVEKLSSHAVEALPIFLRTLEEQTARKDSELRRNEVAMASVRLLDHAHSSQQNPLNDRLYQCALTRIRRLTDSHVQTHERVNILRSCVPNIRTPEKDSTADIQVLKEFIRTTTNAEEASMILELVGSADLVEDLQDYVRVDSRRDPDSRGILLRLHCLVALIWLSGSPPVDSTSEALVKSVFGNEHLSTGIRDAAWDKLFKLGSESGFPSAATPLWTRLMEDHVPSLPAPLATVQLVRFVDAGLKQKVASAELKANFPAVFECVLWKALVRVATCSPQTEVCNAATKIILDYLFLHHQDYDVALEEIGQCQRQFVKDRILNLHQLCATTASDDVEADMTECLRSIDLLYDMLKANDADTATDNFYFDVAIYGAEPKPLVREIRARRSTKVATLLNKLPEYTGTVRNKIIANGVDITDGPDDTLANAIGLDCAGVLLIRPRFTLDDNIDLAFSPAGAVEQEVLAQYELIEPLLEGPESIAARAYRFLRQVRLTEKVRRTVVLPTNDLDVLFPVHRPYRTRFSLFILEQQSADYSRVGVVDKAFSQRVIRLLAGILMDREYRPNVLYEILKVLVIYLRGMVYGVKKDSAPNADTPLEQPLEGHQQALFDKPEAFVSRLFTLLAETRDLPADSEVLQTVQETMTMRTALADICYHAILQAAESDDAFWLAVRAQASDLIAAHKWLLFDKDDALSTRIAIQIINLCRVSDSSFDFPNFYWRTLSACLDHAVKQTRSPVTFFSLVFDVLELDCTTKKDATSMQSLIMQLFHGLERHQHRESPSLLIPDCGMEGLLTLLHAAVRSFISNHGELSVSHDISTHLQTLLFPSAEKGDDGLLIAERTRRAAFELIKMVYTHRDYIGLLDTVVNVTANAPRSPGDQFPGIQEWVRTAHQSAGLTNLGMTCYMNSLLQQLFANLQFRKFIVDQTIEDFQRQNVLASLQQLFTRMQQWSHPVAQTGPLASVLGVQIGSQDDVHTFYTTLLSRLEDCLPRAQQKTALTKFFTGKSVTQIRGDCGHVSARSEAFTELSITVRNKANLHESLDEFVQGEPLEGANKYMCMTCMEDGKGKLVNAMRRTCLEDIPDSLTFCLKRFSFDNFLDGENKVNDRFDFPPEIDMARYKRDHLEDPGAPHESDVFELVGVIVHQGSLSFGHYWSYVRVPEHSGSGPHTWLYIEDEKAFPCSNGINDVVQQCSGGLVWQDGSERPDSAYVLFYQRRRYAAEAVQFNSIPEAVGRETKILPRVNLPRVLAEEVNKDNSQRAFIATLFSHDFTSFFSWLLQQCPDAMKTMEDALSAEGSDVERKFSDVSQDLEVKIASLIVQFATRVLLSHPEGLSRLSEFKLRVAALLKARPSIAAHILSVFAGDDYQLHFETVIRARTGAIGSAVMEMVSRCFAHSRDHLPEEAYKQIVTNFFWRFAEMVPLMQTKYSCWSYCFGFAANFAKHGVFETHIVLQTPCLCRVVEALHVPQMVVRNKPYQHLSNAIRAQEADCTPLFQFLHDLLSGHMDLSVDFDTIAHAGTERLSTDVGWCLTNQEMNQLFRTSNPNQNYAFPLWTVLLSAKFCTAPPMWQDYPPGKFVALLSDAPSDTMREVVGGFVQRHVDGEEEVLQSLLYIVLHFCLARPEHECRILLQSLCKTLHMWHGENIRCLQFLTQAISLRPIAVLETISYWVTGAPSTRSFLLSKSPRARNETAEWLQTHLFRPAPLSDDPSIDAARLRTTRALVKSCDSTLRQAYAREAERKSFEAMILTTTNATAFLLRVQEAVKAAEEEEVSREVQVEADEVRTTLAALKVLADMVEEWVKDDGDEGGGGGSALLPTRSKGFAGTDLEGEEGEQSDDATAAVEEEEEDEDLYN